MFDTILPGDDVDITTRFGHSVAVEDDIAVVGMPHSGEYGYRSGQAFVYQKSDDQWIRVAELVSPAPHIRAEFGSEVAIDNGVIVVSAPNQDVTESGEGALYVYEKDVTWDLIATLTSSEPQPNAGLGESIAIDDDVIIASSPGFDTLSVGDAGRVLVFEEPPGGWENMNQTANLYSSIASSASDFGYEVDILGDTIAIGAPYSYVDEAFNGIVFLYYNNPGTSWESGSESAYLEGKEDYDIRFGREIIITSDRLFIGCRATGEKYNGPPTIYVFEGSELNLVASLAPDNYVLNSSTPMISLHFDGNSIYQGVHNVLTEGISKGAVYRYDMEVGGWESKGPDQTYTSETAFYSRESFGYSLAGNATELFVGNPGHSRNGLSGGAVHVLEKQASNETNVLSETCLKSTYDRYGDKVAISGNYALVYKNDYSAYSARGSVEVLKKSTSMWEKIAAIRPDDFSIYSFATDFDIQGSTIAISGYDEDDIGFVRIYQIVDDTVDASQYDELEPQFDGDLEYFGQSLSLDPYSLVVGGFETVDQKKQSVKLFVFEKENLSTTDYQQEAILTYDFSSSSNQFFKGMHHNQDRILFTSSDSQLGYLINFEKVGSTWDDAILRVIENPESSISDSRYNAYGSSGYLNDHYFITHDRAGDLTNLYTFDLESESVAEPVAIASEFQSFGANFSGSGQLGVSGNITYDVTYSGTSTHAIVFGINEDGSLDSLYRLENPIADSDSNFGGQVAVYGTNMLICAPSESNEAGYFAGAVYAYSTDQAYVNLVTTNQSGTFGPEDNIEMILTFSEAVEVEGTPFILMNLEGNAEGKAYYQSGSGTNQLTFNYEIAGGHNSPVLDYHEDDIKLEGGASILSVSTGEPANTVLPPVGSGQSISGSSIVTVEALPPEITFNSTKNRYNDAFHLQVSFNKDVTGLEISDFVITNAVIHQVTGTGNTYTLHIEPLQEGGFSLYLAEGSVLDQYSQTNGQSEELQLIFETDSPEYLIATNTSYVSSNIVELSFESTEDATVLTDKLTLDNLLIIAYDHDGLSSEHTIKFLIQDKNAPATCSFSVESLVDEAGNLNSQAHTLDVVLDEENPQIFINHATNYLKKGENTLPLTFSEEITDLSFNSIEVINADYALAEDNNKYRLLVTPTGPDVVSITFNEGACFDPSGNPSEEVKYTFRYDIDPPEVTYLLNEVGSEVIKVYMKVDEPVNEITANHFNTTGIESISLTKYVDDSYLLAIRPDLISNVRLSLKPNQIYDAAGNYVVFSEFNHVVTGFERSSDFYDLRWNDSKNELTINVLNSPGSVSIKIHDMMGRLIYPLSSLKDSNVILLDHNTDIFIVVIDVNGSLYSHKISNK